VIEKDVTNQYYDYEIIQANNKITFALDPYAKSMAPFNWTSKEKPLRAKAAFIKKEMTQVEELVSSTNNGTEPIIYEVNIRDLTSLVSNTKSRPGTFNALSESDKIINHLKELGITHVQFLPITSCYSINEYKLDILKKGEGKK
jgi:pullulanase